MCSVVLRESQERKTADGVDCNQISLLICIDKVTKNAILAYFSVAFVLLQVSVVEQTC